MCYKSCVDIWISVQIFEPPALPPFLFALILYKNTLYISSLYNSRKRLLKLLRVDHIPVLGRVEPVQRDSWTLRMFTKQFLKDRRLLFFSFITRGPRKTDHTDLCQAV